jgi:hypothetical protein
LLVFSIDPGVSGAICVFKNKDILEIYDVPTMVDGKKIKGKLIQLRSLTSLKVFYMKVIKFR